MRPDVALAFDRWGDPGGGSGCGWHRFGGEVTGYASFGGLTILLQDPLWSQVTPTMTYAFFGVRLLIGYARGKAARK